MPVDPSIPLQAGQNLPQFGPDLKQIITLQNLAQQMQARQMVMQQEQQGQNALKQIYGNPQNIDPSGYPTPNALRQLMTTSPQVGLELLPQLNKARETDLRAKLIGEKVSDEHRNWAIDEVAVPSVAKYREVLQQTGNPETAQNEAQKVYSERLESVKADGRLGTNAARLSPTFNYSNANANIMGRKGLERAAEMDAKANEPPTPYQKAELGLRAADLDIRQNKERRDIIKSDRGAVGNPDDIEVTKPDGTKEITVGVFDKDKKQYVSADGSGKPIEGKVRKVSPSASSDATLTPEALHPMVEQYLAGDRTVLQNLGRGAQGAANVVHFREELAKTMGEKGLTGTDMARKMAEFEGLKAGERTLGTRAANIEQATNEAAALMPLVRERSAAVSRTQYPSLNAILLAGERETGDPAVVQYGLALNSLLYTYARALNPTGTPRVSDMDHARDLLSKAWSDGQINAALDQMQKEIDAAGASVGRTRQQFGTPGTPASGTPSAQPSTPTPAGRAAVKAGSLDATPEQYEKLPPGAAYTVPGDPKVRYKQ